MKYVVLGANGQLGSDLCPRLAGDVLAWTRKDADLTDPESLRTALARERPNVVINCAAYNFVDRAESEPEAAFAVNVWAVRQLAMICRDLDATLVHFSSDYVFGLDRNRSHPYAESDAPGPISVYGLSKLAGEYQVRSICPKHFVVRTCGLYGVHGTGGKGGNFVETMLRIADQNKPLRVVADQACTPSYTVDVASAVAALIRTDRYGLYHIVNKGSCSWHDFAQEIFHLAGVVADLTPITTREFGATAGRPAYSALNTGAHETLGLPALRSWRSALAAYLDERRTKGK